MSLFDLSGKTALVTGSTRGIGKAIARGLAEQNAKVVITSRKPAAVAAVADEFTAAGYDVLAQVCDVGKKASVVELVNTVLERWGQIDILVCNAATNPVYGPSVGLSDEVWDKVMTTNVKSAFWLTSLVIPHMVARKNGVIILVSSVSALIGEARIGTYAVSKAALAQMARNLAVECGQHNIRVNALAPGVTKTDFAKALWENPQLRSSVESRTPLGRIGDPEDVAGMAVALASEAGRFVTGQTLVIDGGFTVALT